MLDPRTAADPGPWETDRAPHTREWIDNAAVAWLLRVTVMKSTQIGGTEALLNVIAWLVCEAPGPIMFVMPSREEAQQYGDLRIEPMVRLSPRVALELGDDSSDAKARMFRFRRCNLLLRTARVASDLSQLAIRYLFGDEVEQWPTDIGDEGSPWRIAEERLRTFRGRGRAWLNSTPKLPGGIVHQAFLEGDQRRYHVRCACGQWQDLVWERVRWPKDITTEEDMRQRREAWYACSSCERRIDDLQLREMLRRGAWVPAGQDPAWWVENRDRVDRATHRSYHVWAIYSPFLKLWEIVAQWFKLGQSSEARDRRVWHNKWLGVPFAEVSNDNRPETLKRCVRHYRRGDEIPNDILWLTAGVDTQSHYLPWTVYGWRLNGSCRLIDWGRAPTFADVGDLLFRRIWSADTRRAFPLQVRMALMDSRWRERECVEFARSWGQDLVKLSKASDFRDARAYTLSILDRDPVTGRPLERTVHQLGINTQLFKDRVAAAIDRGAAGESADCLELPEDTDETLEQEMTSEHQQKVDGRYGPELQWVVKEGRRANHYWDASVLSFAAATVARLDAMRAELAMLQNRAGPAEPDGPQPPARKPRGDDDRGDYGLWRRS